MSDYYFETGVLRDQMADRLAGNIEQLPYVLAKVAAEFEKYPPSYEELLEGVYSLPVGEQLQLVAFFDRLIAPLKENLAPFKEA